MEKINYQTLDDEIFARLTTLEKAFVIYKKEEGENKKKLDQNLTIAEFSALQEG